MYKKHTPSIYLQFDQGGSFRLSQKQGDIIGFYELDGTKLQLSSADDRWFNTNWDAFTKENTMVLTGLEYGYRTTELRFKKVDKISSFEEFENKLNGKWELYKVSEKGNEKKIANTHFLIHEDQYSITENESVIEEGIVSIDARHEKIIFRNTITQWKARFVWDELRLENDEMQLVYRLRK